MNCFSLSSNLNLDYLCKFSIIGSLNIITYLNLFFFLFKKENTSIIILNLFKPYLHKTKFLKLLANTIILYVYIYQMIIKKTWILIYIYILQKTHFNITNIYSFIWLPKVFILLIYFTIVSYISNITKKLVLSFSRRKWYHRIKYDACIEMCIGIEHEYNALINYV